jgi:hypothetical protein
VDRTVTDRRADARALMPDADTLRATLRPGCSVRVVDLSAGGALVEAERPLRPGARVHVQLVTSARTFTLTARVLRCAVWTLHPNDGVIYRGALQFEDRCELFGEPLTHAGSKVPGALVADSALPGQAIPTAADSPRGRLCRSGK